MRNKNNKKLISVLLVLVALISLFINTNIINADTPNELSLQAYDINPLDEDNPGTGDPLSPGLTGDKLEPGQVFALAIYFVPGTTSGVSFQIGINYPSDKVDPIVDEDGYPIYDWDDSTTYYGGIWPPQGTTTANQKKKTNWTVSTTFNTGTSVRTIINDSTAKKALETEGTMIYFFFQVKDNAAVGSTLPFSFDEDFTMIAEDPPIDFGTNNYTYYVDGDLSSDTSLSALTVKNGTTSYDLDPVFTSGTSTREFDTVVPYGTSSIDLAATMTDTGGTIISGTGAQALNVGNNSLTLEVQAADGTTDTYKINVYRLNNDASLSGLSLTAVDLGEFDPDTTSYTALVPYSTSSTTVTATPNDSKAKVTSGNGSWSLTSTGTTTNDRNIVVEAENCDSKYASVPGNSPCTTKTYSISITRTPASTNNNLKSLKIDGTEIFVTGTTEYTLTDVANSKSTVNVQAEVEDTGKATITTTLGNKSLSVGDNAIVVTVKAEDGSTKDYTVNIRRLSNDNTLSSISFSPTGTLSPSFNPSISTGYTYTAPSTATDVTITATANDSNATINTDLSNPFNIESNPTVNILVTAEDGTPNTYVIKLERAKSSNNYLSSLAVDGYTISPSFNKETTNYTLTVDGTVSSVNVSATVEDTGKATITSGTGSHTLTSGTNTITVTVKAEDNSTKDYTITITKNKNTISTLSDLKVDGVTVPDFSPSTTEYTLPGVTFDKTSVEITATPSDSSATITGDGTVNLSTGSNDLYVTVTAEDGVTTTSYKISIERDKDSNAYLSAINVDGSLISGFLKTINSYDLTVTNDKTSLALTVATESPSATYVISGNSGFITSDSGSYPNTVTILVTAEDGTTNTYTLNVRREKSSNNYLSGIGLSKGTLSPNFNKETVSYSVDVDRSTENITITPTLEDSSASYTISGPSSLQIGDNTFVIAVMSEDGTPKNYTVVVNRNKSSNNYLSSLNIDGSLITGFNKETTSYSIDVPSSTASVNITATAEDSLSTVTGEGVKTLAKGNNSFDIVVKAENDSEKTYTVNINRLQSSDSSLSNLSIVQTTISPTFSPSILSYTASVGYSVTNIDIVATASDSTSTVTGDGNKSLNTGSNSFDVIVTAEDGTSTTTYNITVNRDKNNNANLSNITLSGGHTLSPAFDPDTTTYNVTVPNTESTITVTAYKQDPNAVSVVGDGVQTLSTGSNQIDIVVTAEDGTTKKTYTVNIYREQSSDATLSSLTVDHGTLSPTFDPDTTEYTVTVDNEVENLGVTYTTTSDAASAVVSGNTNLSVGNNTCTVVVTAEDGTLKTYTLTITRNPSTDNFLSSLSVKDDSNNEYITDFERTKTLYNITVENEIENVTIDGTLSDNSSTMTGTGSKTLSVGNNEYEVVVTSTDNVSRTYKINIFRKGNANNNLSNLTVSDGTLVPGFDKDTTSYTVDVDNTVSSITITATPEVSTSTVTGDGEHTLTTGANNIEVNVQSEDGSNKTYTIVVNKAADNNSNLASLSVSEGTLSPSFSKTITEYSVSIPNTTNSLTITAIPEVSTSTVTGDGLKSVNVGSNDYEIEVTAEDGITKTIYKITVTRDASSVNKLSDLTVDGSTIDGFNPNENTYSLNVPNDKESVVIGATVLDPTSTVSGIGTINLDTGNNTIPVAVTAEDGSINTYTITVNRAKNSNNYLKELSVAEGILSPEFNKNTETYTVTVPNEVTQLTINAEPEVTTSTVQNVNNGSFVVGDNTVNVNVTAEDGSTKEYKIVVIRQPYAENFLSSLRVTDDDGILYALSPTYNKTTLSYDVEIPSTLTSVNIEAIPENTSATVVGDGTLPITSLPQTQRVTVTENGISRNYTLVFKQGLSANSKLLSLSVNPGTLSPVFSSNTYTYSVELPSGTSSITISATADSNATSVSGTGTFNITSENSTFRVLVTAENGNISTYTINVHVQSLPSSGNKLTSLEINPGTLSPTFDPDTRQYSATVDGSTPSITISATGPNTITGIGTKNLDDGNNVFEVKSIDDSGNENVYRVIVTKTPSETSPVNGSNELIYLDVDEYGISPEFTSNNTEYSTTISGVSSVDVIAVPKDPNATVSITGNDDIENNNITVTVTPTTGDPKVYTINTSSFMNKLESDVYVLDDTYTNRVPLNKTSATLKSEFKNPDEYLKIYDSDGVELSDTDLVGTGYTIKLIKDGIEYDSKIIIVLTDLNGDAEVSVSDIILIRQYILETGTLSATAEKAAYVNEDDEIDIADLLLIKKAILEGGE